MSDGRWTGVGVNRKSKTASVRQRSRKRRSRSGTRGAGGSSRGSSEMGSSSGNAVPGFDGRCGTSISLDTVSASVS